MTGGMSDSEKITTLEFKLRHAEQERDCYKQFTDVEEKKTWILREELKQLRQEKKEAEEQIERNEENLSRSTRLKNIAYTLLTKKQKLRYEFEEWKQDPNPKPYYVPDNIKKVHDELMKVDPLGKNNYPPGTAEREF
jgi:chromosome segregation ATPase